MNCEFVIKLRVEREEAPFISKWSFLHEAINFKFNSVFTELSDATLERGGCCNLTNFEKEGQALGIKISGKKVKIVGGAATLFTKTFLC